MKRLLSTVVVLVLLAHPIGADEGPTLKETTDWLKGVLTTEFFWFEGSSDLDGKTVLLMFDEVPCEGIFETTVTRYRKKSDSRSHMLTLQNRVGFHFGWLTPNFEWTGERGEAGEDGRGSLPELRFWTKDRKHLLERGGRVSGGLITVDAGPPPIEDRRWIPSEINKLDIIIEKRETAERVAKAMQHAIKLCGGTADPF